MEPKKFRGGLGPEAIIQKNFIVYLRERGWEVERMIGNELQKGIPDIYVMHPEYGDRWIDLKNPSDYEFTTAQIIKWPKWEAHGKGIWIITGWSDDDYAKLFQPPNMRDYWKPKYDEQIAELTQDLQDLFDDFETDS
jgi:hypothetical protein